MIDLMSSFTTAGRSAFYSILVKFIPPRVWRLISRSKKIFIRPVLDPP
jgi:hypothetical protein